MNAAVVFINRANIWTLSLFVEPSDEVVAKLKRKDRITAHYCGSAEPEWVAQAEEVLKVAEEFAATNPMEHWNAETKADLKALALAGKKTEAIRIYKDLFMCSLAEAKAAIARMIDSKEKS